MGEKYRIQRQISTQGDEAPNFDFIESLQAAEEVLRTYPSESNISTLATVALELNIFSFFASLRTVPASILADIENEFEHFMRQLNPRQFVSFWVQRRELSLDLLVQELRGENQLTQSIAAAGLASRGESVGLSKLQEQVQCKDESARFEAATSLSELKASFPYDVLEKLIQKTSFIVNSHLKALAFIAESRALKILEAFSYTSSLVGRTNSWHILSQSPSLDISQALKYWIRSALQQLNYSENFWTPTQCFIRSLGGSKSQKSIAAQALARLDAKEAIPILDLAAIPEPDYVAALAHLAPDVALDVLDRFDHCLQRLAWPDRLRGQARFNQGEFVAALGHFQKAADLDYDLDEQLALGHFHIERGNPEKAFQAIDHARDFDFSHAVACLSEALVHLQLGDPTTALERLEDAQLRDRWVLGRLELKFTWFWREKAFALLDELLALNEPYEAPIVPPSKVAEPTFD